MRAKDTVALTSLRAIKSAILLSQTQRGAAKALTTADEIALLQRLVKQRKESAAIYQAQGREDLAMPELEQVEVISQFLPTQLSAPALREALSGVIDRLGASGMKDMGRVMGQASKELAGKADGKSISRIVKELLGN